MSKSSSALVLGLESNQNFDLFLRYRFQPENVNHYTIAVNSFWWQKKGIQLTGILAFIFLVLAGILKLQQKRKIKLLQKKETEHRQTRMELKAIYAQLNPHFIFNSLASIQGLINKNDIPAANHYLSEFSSLLRESLGNNDKEMVPLATELKILETYLKLEQLRFHFQYTIVVDETINKNAVEVPSLLLQPLVENAIKHGVASLNEQGLVKIKLLAQGNTLLVSVSDNGSGFVNQSPGKGLGLKLTKDRIQLLNQTLKEQPIQLTIESGQNTGTTVHLSFENWL